MDEILILVCFELSSFFEMDSENCSEDVFVCKFIFQFFSGVWGEDLNCLKAFEGVGCFWKKLERMKF